MTDRADAMARRLAGTARRLGIADPGRALILSAFDTAMEPRRRGVPDDHHPDYLHPARTALILMHDAGETDPAILAVALLAESRDPALAAPAAAVERLGHGVAEALAAIPVPGRSEEPLLESLLALPQGRARVAVAERLDHARHLHLRDRREWTDYHATTCATYAPVAGRVHETLGGRLGWWCATFSRRFLHGAG